jgi:hypothetical protein
MEKITISLSKEEMQYIEILLLEDAFKIRKKLDDDIEESNKEGILIDFKNFVSNNSIKTKIICGKER